MNLLTDERARRRHHWTIELPRPSEGCDLRRFSGWVANTSLSSGCSDEIIVSICEAKASTTNDIHKLRPNNLKRRELKSPVTDR
nr:hypothetical protein Itr_chr11CG20800 [Ipomoea trifida]